MSKKHRRSAPKKQKIGSLTYQIKHLELSRKGKKDTPMLAKRRANTKSTL